jgi:hypothetical protein
MDRDRMPLRIFNGGSRCEATRSQYIALWRCRKRDHIVVRALDGTDVSVDEKAITLIAGPHPHDVGPHTYVHGIDRGVLVTAEDAAALVARLGVPPSLARLTRPDLTPVWLKGSAVTALRAPPATEQQAPGSVNAVAIVGGLHQAVHETVEAARAIVNAPGGTV